MPKVSFLFLTYNRLGETIRCFKSLLPTLLENPQFSCHVLDNASVDQTPQWLLRLQEKYPQFKIHLSAVNLGVAGGRDYLIRQSKADIIISLDSDVIFLDKTWYKPLLKRLEDKSIGVVGQSGHKLLPNLIIPYSPDYEGSVSVISGYCQAWRRRDMLRHSIHLDMQFNYGGAEDDDFCMQWLAKGYLNWKVKLPIVHEWAGTWSTGSYEYNKQLLWSKWFDKKSALPVGRERDLLG